MRLLEYHDFKKNRITKEEYLERAPKDPEKVYQKDCCDFDWDIYYTESEKEHYITGMAVCMLCQNKKYYYCFTNEKLEYMEETGYEDCTNDYSLVDYIYLQDIQKTELKPVWGKAIV